MSKAAYNRPMQIKKHALFKPDEDELVEILSKGLSKNYKNVEVCFKICPDLSEHPFNLASKGICGNPTLADVGGVPFLVPGPAKWQERVYDLRHVCRQVEQPNGFILGACACSRHYLGCNAELMPNSSKNFNNTHCAKMINFSEEDHTTEKYDSTEFTLLANLFISKGEIGKTLHVSVKNRIGKQKSLVHCMQEAIKDHYGTDDDKIVGLGGCFVSLGKTTTKIHIMPDFSKTPLNTDEDVSNWLKFFHTKAPISHLSFSTSGDVSGFDIRTEHTHSFSYHGDGGHYHGDSNDIDPENVEYEGYFSVCDFVYRIDQPEETHQVGRD